MSKLFVPLAAAALVFAPTGDARSDPSKDFGVFRVTTSPATA